MAAVGGGGVSGSGGVVGRASGVGGEVARRSRGTTAPLKSSGVPTQGPAAEDFARILLDSFPPGERDEPAEILRSVEQGVRRCVTAFDGERLIGFAVLLPLRSADAVLLEYLAVERSVRSAGIGGELFDRTVTFLAASSAPPSGLIFEVDPPELAEGAEGVTRRRRIAFYERHGAHLLSRVQGYRVPSTDDARELPYLLMWRPLGVEQPTREQLRQTVGAVLQEDYGREADDPLVRSVLAGVEV
jgi:hypothetical protein